MYIKSFIRKDKFLFKTSVFNKSLRKIQTSLYYNCRSIISWHKKNTIKSGRLVYRRENISESWRPWENSLKKTRGTNSQSSFPRICRGGLSHGNGEKCRLKWGESIIQRWKSAEHGVANEPIRKNVDNGGTTKGQWQMKADTFLFKRNKIKELKKYCIKSKRDL